MFQSVHSVMIHVPDIQAACKWYADVLGLEPKYLLPDYPVLRIGGVEICFHKADAKVSTGKAGTVIYWRVESFEGAVRYILRKGGQLHRGPLPLEDGDAICQIQDPFGNLFGLIGKG
jgi:predicted enzyme related to lactoylglutathione lyase